MLKPLVVATAALAIAGSSIVYAQQRFGGSGHGDGPRLEHRQRLSVEDMAAFTDARIAALNAGLKLTADQAKNWPAFEQALRDMAQLRLDLRQSQEAAGRQGEAWAATPFDRLGQKAGRLSKLGAALTRIADAGAPLYASLTDAQKHRFRMLSHMLQPYHHHRTYARNDDAGRGWRQGRGYGGNDGYRHRREYEHEGFEQNDRGADGGEQQRLLP